MKSKLLLLIIIGFAVVTLTAVGWGSQEADHTNFLNSRAELLMRSIGHQVLWFAGDSTSLVLPVTRSNNNTFQVRFQKEFSFMPDTLIQIVDRSLTAARVPLQYRVSVFDCRSHALVYGFEVMKQGSVVPCEGRLQPTGCYSLQVEFLSGGKKSSQNYYMLAFTLALFTLVGVIGSRLMKKKEVVPVSAKEPAIQLGVYQFLFNRNMLVKGKEQIELSDKETRILKIFADTPNQLIDRERLLKEVWEDEGVFVGRSLDVFVSRLRKKLQKDPSLRIVNIHGKGYKLEMV